MNLTFLHVKNWFLSSRWEITAAVIGLILRVWYWLDFSSSPLFSLAVGPDVSEYHARALEILSGIWFPAGADMHAPFYSWFLAGCYALWLSIPAVRMVQLLLNWGALLGLFGALGHFRILPQKENRIFLGIAMGYPVVFFHQGELISESLLFPLLGGCLLFLFAADRRPRRRTQYSAAAGFFAGLAAITHPMTLSFAVLEVGISLCRRRWLAAAALAAGTMIAVLPVSLKNSFHAGRPVLIQENGAFNFWLGNRRNGSGGCDIRPGAYWKSIHRKAKEISQKRGISIDRYFWEKIAKFWRTEPARAATLLGRKASMVWDFHERISGADPELVVRHTTLVYCGGLLTGLLFYFCWAGIFMSLRERRLRHRFLHFLLLVGGLWLAQTLTVTSGRYRAAMLLGIYPLAAWGLVHFPYRRWGWLVAVFFLGALLVFPGMTNKPEAAALYGEAEYRRGNLARAREYLLYAERKIFDPARFDNLIGMIDWGENRQAEAERRFRNAMRRVPREPEAAMNLANLCGSQSRDAEAEKLYLNTLKMEPEYSDLRYNYGWFLQQRGRKEEAEKQYLRLLEKHPQYAAGWNSMGILLVARGDWATAENCFENAVRYAPGNSGFEHNLQWVRMRRRKL